MSDYSKSTNFTSKDTLPTGNAGKIVKGTELDIEFTAIASAVSSKANISSPDLLGTPTTPTATVGSNTTQIASTAFVKTAVDTGLATLGTMSTQAASAVAITGGTIAGITDLAIADGGTGVSSLTAHAVLVGNGTSAIQVVSPGTTGNVLTSDGTQWNSTAPASVKGLGLSGETWHNVSGSRSSGTTYTNSYSYPIMVMIQMHTGSAGTNPSEVYVGSFTVWRTSSGGWTGGTDTTATFIVPPGVTYSTNSSSSGSLWMELY